MKKSFIHSVRHPNLALWLSAVEATVNNNVSHFFHKNNLPTDDHHPMVKATSDHINDLVNGKLIPEHPLDNFTDPHDPGLLKNISNDFFELAEAHRENDISKIEEIKVKHLKYSKFDIMGWTSSVLTYLEYFDGGILKPHYNDWKIQGQGNINSGLIEYKLPNDARVAIIGDWGTGTHDAKDMLVKIMDIHKPDAIIHLGDIYYAGTPAQCKANFLDVFDEIFSTRERVPVFNLPGNHDYYALAKGFYGLLEQINPASEPSWQQRTSYFCLRTEDNSWQFLGMDTGIGDYDPKDQISNTYTGPVLQPSEIEWHRDKLENFNGRTILLSHHQLFSANNRIGAKKANRPYLNEHLYEVFSPYFNSIGMWLWGHEHNLAMYQNDLFGLAKGRLLGCGSYNAAHEEDPYKVNYPEVPYLYPMVKLGITSNYYNHGYAILDMKRKQPSDSLNIKYYQLPVWMGDESKNLPDDQEHELFKEEIN